MTFCRFLEAASGQEAPASLVTSGCTLIVGADSTMVASISGLRAPTRRCASPSSGASLVDSKGAQDLPEERLGRRRRRLAGRLPGSYRLTGMHDDHGHALHRHRRSAFSTSPARRCPRAQGVDAYNLANLASITVLGWNP